MKSKTYAAIDIGSNAARLLIKKSLPDSLEPSIILRKQLLVRVPLRLGFDVFSKGKVSPKKGENLIRLMKAYRQLMKIYNVDQYRACATSAMRDAANGEELIDKIKEATGIDIEIIAGEEEAAIVYNNHIESCADPSGRYLYVDVGGGSTEINYLTDGELKRSASFNIGTVRILSGKVKDEEWRRLNDFLHQVYTIPCADGCDCTTRIIGSGGNINKLFKLADPDAKDDQSFTVDELARLYHTMKPLSDRQRMEKFNLRPDRADVIIPAAEIFLNIASVVKAQRIYVPMIGVSDGIIDGMYEADLAREREE